jgi:hypothetical protein
MPTAAAAGSSLFSQTETMANQINDVWSTEKKRRERKIRRLNRGSRKSRPSTFWKISFPGKKKKKKLDVIYLNLCE